LADLEDLYAVFPRLRCAEHRITSAPVDDYNCVAWIERDLKNLWDPDFYWPREVEPPPIDTQEDLPYYLGLFEWLGFERCDGPELEPGYLKIAVYATANEFHHVAKQLPSSAWSSKGGVDLHDFRHADLDPLDGTKVWKGASAVVFMRRSYDGVDKFEIEERGLFIIGEIDAPAPMDSGTESSLPPATGASSRRRILDFQALD
jgi:hypothetical protein